MRFFGPAARIALLFGSLCAGLAPASAQDAWSGAQIARTWCVNCHQIAPSGKVPRDDVPSLVSVAQMSSTTQLSLTVFLSTPHDRMPDYALSRTEIADVSAYILSLRRPQ